MPIKLLIPFLTKSHISIYLGITFLIINTSCHKLCPFTLQKILLIEFYIQKIVHTFFQCNRSWVFKLRFLFKTYTIYSVSTLGNTIILCIENLEIHLIATIVFKCFFNHIPGFAFIMAQHSFNIFKKKYFWLTFYYNTCKFSEQSSTSIFKTSMLSSQRERLTRSSTYK